MGATEAIAQTLAPAAVLTPAASLAAGERELRIDLFRGLALWLIFIDHMSPDLLSWFTIRSYGFSDAAEIFIFISGYTAAFVYGRAMLQVGVVVATARILRRVWQIYVANVFLFTIFFAEIAYVGNHFSNPLYTEEMGVNDLIVGTICGGSDATSGLTANPAISAKRFAAPPLRRPGCGSRSGYPR